LVPGAQVLPVAMARVRRMAADEAGQVAEEDVGEEKNPSWGDVEEETHLGRLPAMVCGGFKGDVGEGPDHGLRRSTMLSESSGWTRSSLRRRQ
jgi:hypothetical protein